MIEQVRLAFAGVHAAPAVDGPLLRLVRVTPACQAWVGEDPEYRPHLILLLTTDATVPPSLDAVLIRRDDRVIDGRARAVVDVICTTPALVEVFHQFIAAVLTRMVSVPADGPAALATVLETWRRFLHAGGPPIGREKLAALFGELTVLAELAAIDPAAALASWAGADRTRHDFRGAAMAVEVKTTTATSGSTVTIHGDRQLLPPDDGQLHLHLVRLETVAGAGRPLRSLVDAVLDAGADPTRFFDQLQNAGLPIAQLRDTDDVTFDVRERLTVPVDDAVPRIVPYSFAGGHTPTGVQGLTYRIDLDPQRHRALDDDAWHDLLDRIAAGARR